MKKYLVRVSKFAFIRVQADSNVDAMHAAIEEFEGLPNRCLEADAEAAEVRCFTSI